MLGILSAAGKESDGGQKDGYGSKVHEQLLPGLQDVGGDGDCLRLCGGVGGCPVPVFVGQVDVHGIDDGGGGQDVVFKMQALVEVGC